MDVRTFNQLLKSLYSDYISIRQFRKQLSALSQHQLILAISKIDKQNKSYITLQDIIEYIDLTYTTKDNIKIQPSLTYLFPFQKISYSTIMTHCQVLQSPSSKSNSYSFEKNTTHPSTLIRKILKCQINLFLQLPNLIQLIPIYIPFIGKELTINQISQFIKSQNLCLDVDSIVEMINYGGKRQSNIIHKFNKIGSINQQEKDNQHYLDIKVNQINKIIDRLAHRIDKFGNQWLNFNKISN